MHKPAQILSIALIALFIILPAHADINDFFKGGADSVMDEIIELAGEPVKSENVGNEEYDYGWRLDYDAEFMHFPAALTYYFNLQDRLKTVQLVIPLENITLKEHETLLSAIKAFITDNADPFAHWVGGSKTDDGSTVFYAEEWLNNTYYITLLSRAALDSNNDSLPETEPTEIRLRFAAVPNADADTQKAIQSFAERILATYPGNP